jgi:transcriptional regulator with XRE-family HTH domain
MQAENHNMLLFLRHMKKQEQHYGRYLKSLRRDAGLTQVELATRLKVAQSNIAFWERSEKPPRSEILKPLAKALNVTLETLLDVEPFEPSRPPVQGKLAKAFGKASTLSRRQQEKIAEVVNALTSQASK